jgi:carbon-monoxide dehydrogenase catalytic subunit
MAIMCHWQKKALRLGLSTIYTAQIGLEMTQDILFGTPMPHEVSVDLGIMDPNYVNIAFNGHQPWIGAATLQKAKMPEYQKMARDVGAKGLRVVGSIETGQELLQRYEVDDVFVGLMGNWISIEPFLATGTVDAFVMEENWTCCISIANLSYSCCKEFNSCYTKFKQNT